MVNFPRRFFLVFFVSIHFYSETESPDYQFGVPTQRPSSNSSAGSLGRSLSNNNPDIDQYKEALLKLDTVQRRCDDMSSQLNYYKDQYMAAMNQLKTDDRTKYSDIVSENVRLKQRNSILDKQLRLYNDSQSSQNNFKEGFYSDDPYNELGVSSNSNCSGICFKSEKFREDLQLCKKRCNDLTKYISNCQLDNNSLRQKVTGLLLFNHTFNTK